MKPIRNIIRFKAKFAGSLPALTDMSVISKDTYRVQAAGSKNLLPILALAFMSTAAIAPAAIIQYNPTQINTFTDTTGFTGDSTVGSNPFAQIVVFFEFTGLTSPLPSNFEITNIRAEGQGITTFLSFSNLLIDGNGFFATAAANLNTTLFSVDLSQSNVSFTLPGDNVINEGALLSLSLQYKSTGPQNAITSGTGPILSAIPEPSTAILGGIGSLLLLRRRRS